MITLKFQISKEVSVEASVENCQPKELFCRKFEFTEEGGLYTTFRSIGVHPIYEFKCSRELSEHVDQNSHAFKIYQGLKKQCDTAFVYIKKTCPQKNDFWIIRKEKDVYVICERFHDIWQHEVQIISDG